jgi:hypothetical protein
VNVCPIHESFTGIYGVVRFGGKVRSTGIHADLKCCNCGSYPSGGIWMSKNKINFHKLLRDGYDLNKFVVSWCEKCIIENIESKPYY